MEVAISDDGSTIVSSDGVRVRVVDASGALKGQLEITSNELWDVAVTANGSQVVFLLRRDATVVGAGTVLQRGIWRMNADGGGLAKVLVADMVAPLVGKQPTDIGLFYGCGPSLAVSGDGSKVYGIAAVAGVGDAIFGATAGGASLVEGPITAGQHRAISVAVSQDGKKLATWVESTSTTGSEIASMAPDGSGKTKLLEADPLAGCGGTPFTLSKDGARLALGARTLVLPTDGATTDRFPVLAAMSGEYWQIGAPDDANSAQMSMSSDAKHFVYLANDGVVGRNIAYAEIDPASVPPPQVTQPKVTPASLPRDGQTKATLEARVSGEPYRVGSTVFLGGQPDGNNVSAQNVLLGDGGVYRFDNVTAQPTAAPGPRILRIRAEAKSSTGVRSAHAVDFGPLAIED
jgi:hypothetical protein